MSELPSQSPLYHAEHSDRYERQALIRQYEEATKACLIVVIDTIGPWSITYLEELFFNCGNPGKDRNLHLMLETPGGDGEIAVRMARSLQARCRKLTVIVPDRAKSAGTLLAMGAHKIIMGPTSDLGPVDPQLYIPHARQRWIAAHDLIEAVDGALDQVQKQPTAFQLMASLLSDVNYLMYQQAKSAMERLDDLIEAALASNPKRNSQQVQKLVKKLKKESIITDPKVHGAIFGSKEAAAAGLPVLEPPSEEQWEIIWRLWAKYFHLRQLQEGWTRIYENRTASQVVTVS